MTLGLTKVPITKKEESTQVEEKKWVQTFFTPRAGVGGGDHQGGSKLWVLVY